MKLQIAAIFLCLAVAAFGQDDSSSSEEDRSVSGASSEEARSGSASSSDDASSSESASSSDSASFSEEDSPDNGDLVIGDLIPTPRAVPITIPCDADMDLKVGKLYKVTSPNYPYKYPNNARCDRSFVIPADTKVEMVCSQFIVPCNKNSEGNYVNGDWFQLKLNDRPYIFCNNELKNKTVSFPVYSSEYDLEINFASNSFERKLGFKCFIEVIDMSDDATEAPTTTTTTAEPVTGEPATTAAPTTGCKCGRVSGADRIVGGVTATPNNYPWQAGLVGCSTCSKPYCGGTIISEKYILTAAHCTQDANPYYVVVGEHDTSTNNDDAKIYRATKINHPNYNDDTMSYDYALLELDTPLTFSDDVQPACMPTPGKYVGEKATVTGWGTTSSGGSQPSKLRTVDVNIIANSECEKTYGGLTNNMLCAIGDGKDSCQGDSGGPLVVEDVLVGVVSYGYGCASPGIPGVYARVTSVQTLWIEKYAKNTCTK